MHHFGNIGIHKGRYIYLIIRSMTQERKKLEKMPGVGNKIAKYFWEIGLKDIKDFEGKDPVVLYNRLCEYQQCQVDRCMLYVCRCCVYFAENKHPDPEKLKWRNWKDEE